jgi:hypothetical protein
MPQHATEPIATDNLSTRQRSRWRRRINAHRQRRVPLRLMRPFRVVVLDVLAVQQVHVLAPERDELIQALLLDALG